VRVLRGALLVLGVVLASGCTMTEFEGEARKDRKVIVANQGWHMSESLKDSDKSDQRESGAEARRLLKKAAASFKAERWSEAAEDYDDAYSAATDPETAEPALYGAGESYFRAIKLEEAHRRFQMSLRTFPRSLQYAAIVRRIFELGKLGIEGKYSRRKYILFGDVGREFGLEVLEGFLRDQDRHPNADDALYLIATERLRLEQPESAIVAWNRLIEEYPASEWRRLSEIRVAEAHVQLVEGAVRERKPLLKAIALLRRYLRRYPTGDNLPVVRGTLKGLEESVAAEDLFIARGYERASEPNIIARWFRAVPPREAYLIYLRHILKEYPKTAAAKEAKLLLAQERVS